MDGALRDSDLFLHQALIMGNQLPIMEQTHWLFVILNAQQFPYVKHLIALLLLRFYQKAHKLNLQLLRLLLQPIFLDRFDHKTYPQMIYNCHLHYISHIPFLKHQLADALPNQLIYQFLYEYKTLLLVQQYQQPIQHH